MLSSPNSFARETEWSEMLDGFASLPNDNYSEEVATEGGAAAAATGAATSDEDFAQLIKMPMILMLIGFSSAFISLLVTQVVSWGTDFRLSLLDYHWSIYVCYSLALAIISCLLTMRICPHAASSGLPEMKAILSGVIKPVLLSKRLIVAKLLGLTTALLAGLSVGKEGPFVHVSAAVASQLLSLPFFKPLVHLQDTRRLEILSCACASGVSSCFGTAFGGVLFSIEFTASAYSIKNLPRAFLASVCGMLVFAALHKAEGEQVFLQKTNQDRSFIRPSFSEIMAFIIIGIVCGILGVIFVVCVDTLTTLKNTLLDTSCNSPRIIACRKVLLVTFATAIIAPLSYLELSSFASTAAGSSSLVDYIFQSDYQTQPNAQGVVESQTLPHTAAGAVVNTPNLVAFFLYKFVTTAIAVTLPLPVGLFTPVFLTGGVLGRIIGEALNSPKTIAQLAAWISNDTSQVVFTTVFTPREFALVGAAAFSTGVTRAISTAVIIFELSNSPHLCLPISVSILAAYFTGQRLYKNVYDALIDTNAIPFIGDLPRSEQHVSVSIVMQPLNGKSVLALGDSVEEAARVIGCVCAQEEFLSHLAVVDSRERMVLLGVVNLAQVKRLVKKIRLEAKEGGRGGEEGDILAFETVGDTPSPLSSSSANASAAASATPNHSLTPLLKLSLDTAPYLISHTCSLARVYSAFGLLKLNQAHVIKEGRLIGVLSRGALRKYLTQKNKFRNPRERCLRFLSSLHINTFLCLRSWFTWLLCCCCNRQQRSDGSVSKEGLALIGMSPQGRGGDGAGQYRSLAYDDNADGEARPRLVVETISVQGADQSSSALPGALLSTTPQPRKATKMPSSLVERTASFFSSL